MLKLSNATYLFELKSVELSLSGDYNHGDMKSKVTLEELEQLIVQLQKVRMMMVVDADQEVTKRLVENIKQPDDKLRSILLEEKPAEQSVA